MVGSTDRASSLSTSKLVIRWSIGLAVAGLAMWAILRGLDWQAVKRALSEADYRWVALGICAILGTVVARVWRWQTLLYRDAVTFPVVLMGILVGQVVNTAVPMMRSGDVARTLWISRRKTLGISQIAGSIVLEKVWDLMMLGAFGVALLMAIPLPQWFTQSTWGMVLALGAGLVVLYLGLHWQEPLLGLIAKVLQRFPGRVGQFLMPQLGELVTALDAIRHPGASIRAGLWSMAYWLFGVIANWAVMQAFGVGELWPATFLMVTLMLGGAAVPTPARIGVFEGICVVSLGLFGIERDLALAIGFVLHVVVLGPPLVLAALMALVTAFAGDPGQLRRADGD